MSFERRPEEPENHDRWLVSYADFITLLFAFFVVLYATSTQNEEKEKKFEQSIRAQFKMALMNSGNGSGTGATISKGPLVDPFEVLQKKDIRNIELMDSVERILSHALTEKERKEIIADVRHDAIGVRITLAASAFFPTGSAKIKSTALVPLDKIAEILKKTSHRLIIEGHTDDLPVVGGEFESNWELASLRATSVVRYLIKAHGINPQRLAAISYADQRPIEPNLNEKSRSHNRRIEILIVNSNQDEFE